MAGLTSALSGVISAIGTIAAGQAQKRQAEYQARLQDIQANERRAEGQRDAFDKARERRLALSRLQAVAGASGLGASDPSIVQLAGETARYGTLAEQIARYAGETRGRDLKAQAAMTRMDGEQAARRGLLSGIGGLLNAGSSFFGR